MAARKAIKGKVPRVGSRVRFELGGRNVVATVIEDRGGVGMGGRRLLRVRLHWAEVAEPIEFEIPAAHVRGAA